MRAGPSPAGAVRRGPASPMPRPPRFRPGPAGVRAERPAEEAGAEPAWGGGEEETVPTLLLPPSAPPPSRDSTSHHLLLPGPPQARLTHAPGTRHLAAARTPPAGRLGPPPRLSGPRGPRPRLLPRRSGPAPRRSRASRPQARPLLPSPPSSLLHLPGAPVPPPLESGLQPSQGRFSSRTSPNPTPVSPSRGGCGHRAGSREGRRRRRAPGKAPGRREEGGCERCRGGRGRR